MVYKVKALSRVQKRQVKAIAAKTVEVKAEHKVYETAAADLSWSSTVSITALLPTFGTQGVQAYERVGNKVSILSIHGKGMVQLTNANAVLRAMIVQYIGTSSTPPTAPPLSGYSNSLATENQANMTLFYLRKQDSAAAINTNYKVIYDKIMPFDNNGTTRFIPFEFNVKDNNLKDSVINYQTGAAVYENPVYLMLFSDTATASTPPQLLSFRYRTTYTDN
jgi:hypothetical protein